MRDPKRIKKFCNELAEIWETQCPDWRFAQLIINIMTNGELAHHTLFYTEDEEMMQYIKRYFHLSEVGESRIGNSEHK